MVEVPPLRIDRGSFEDMGEVSRVNLEVARLAVKLANSLLAATREAWNSGPGKSRENRIPSYRHPAPKRDDVFTLIESRGLFGRSYVMNISGERTVDEMYFDDLTLHVVFGGGGVVESMTSIYDGDIRKGYQDGLKVEIRWPYRNGGFADADVKVTFPDMNPNWIDEFLGG